MGRQPYHATSPLDVRSTPSPLAARSASSSSRVPNEKKVGGDERGGEGGGRRGE